ncbi:MAG: Rieske 2Fe-2S domain-containing protein [Chloroflexi bacterium]|nr:Rieske 2Fe-2S domain-containing protein [Chloroflexota bacterium]
MLSGIGATLLNSLYPRGVAGFGGPVAVLAAQIPKPGAPPVQNIEGHFLLVNLAPGEGRLASDETPAEGGLLALWWKCPHLGCTVPWRNDFVSPHDDGHRRGDFVCPCHGSTYTRAGVRIFGPAPRSLDTMEIELTKTGITVQTGKRREGSEDNPRRAIPYAPLPPRPPTT